MRAQASLNSAARKGWTASAFDDLHVSILQMVYLPAAGLAAAELPPALLELVANLPGQEDLRILKSLPELEPLTLADPGEEDLLALAKALAGKPGFIIQMETPKRRWFSDGTERINWGDTWTEWAYAPNEEAIGKALKEFVARVVEDDGRQHPRVFDEDFAEP